jgi:hypothetical protein
MAAAPPRYTRDGRDGFPSEAVFDAQVAEYLAALNLRKRDKALVRPRDRSETSFDP